MNLQTEESTLVPTTTENHKISRFPKNVAITFSTEESGTTIDELLSFVRDLAKENGERRVFYHLQIR